MSERSLVQQIIRSPATLWVCRRVPNQFDVADAGAMCARLHIHSFGRAIWILSRSLLPLVMEMEAGRSDQHSLLGMPAIFTDGLPQSHEQCAALLVDHVFLLSGSIQGAEIIVLADGTTQVSRLVGLV